MHRAGWEARGPARIILLAGFLFARTTTNDVFIDLRDAQLMPSDGVQLARLLRDCSKLTAIDVRGNETLGEEGTQALVEFLYEQRSNRSEPRSLLGITPGNTSLSIPKQLMPYECRMLCAELESSTFSEGMSSAMGAKSKTTTLNRRGGHASDQWQPLIWAAKDGHLLVAEQLLNNGHDINKTEPLQDKGNSAWAPLHWAAAKDNQKILEMLIQRGANVQLKDKHGSMAKTIAEKKNHKAIVAMLEAAEGIGRAPPQQGASSTVDSQATATGAAPTDTAGRRKR